MYRMLNRKEFIRQAALTTGSIVAAPIISKATNLDKAQRLIILHTNDTHSRLDPFPMDGSRNQGLGGVARRAQLIKQIREQEEHVLLLDAGDIFQGTPYFNIYKGEPEIKAMSAMGYDACTIGNHDFDAGMENLATQLDRHANFPMLVSNYDFTGTPMEGKTQPHKIFTKGRLKIGVFGLGIEGKGLVPDILWGDTKYLDPIATANRVAGELKNDHKCDMVICLSHLGNKYDNEPKVSDEILAKNTSNIDLIIGGHTHTFLEAPLVYKNQINREVLVNQVGFAGIILGRLDFEFSKFSGKNFVKNESISVSQKTIQ